MEPALYNRLSHLDLMCFSALFPTGEFGQNHPRKVKLTFSEYVKSCLLNQVHKSPEFVFYCLWKKALKSSNGICNLLKKIGRQGISTKQLLQRVNANNNQLEANLTTTIQ